MPTTNMARNLRDGQLTVNDGAGTPASLTLSLDTGDLAFTLNQNTIQVLDRGSMSSPAHTRPGNDAAVDLSFSTAWVEFLGSTLATPIDETLYEMVTNEGGGFTSTDGDGAQHTLEFVFVVADPAGGTSTDEQITFAKCYYTTFACSEGDEYNTMTYTGVDFEKKPTIVRV